MTSILVALITGGLSLAGVIFTNMASNKKVNADMQVQAAITNEKIAKLTEQVEKHNSVIERTYKLEQQSELHKEKIKVINHRIEDLEKEKSK